MSRAAFRPDQTHPTDQTYQTRQTNQAYRDCFRVTRISASM
jgi:hypothetical protein